MVRDASSDFVAIVELQPAGPWGGFAKLNPPFIDEEEVGYAFTLNDQCCRNGSPG